MLLAVALAVTSLTTSFDVGGVKVILRKNPANNVVAANLYLLGGSRQITPQTAGIEPFLLDVSDRGTRGYPKSVLRRKMSRLGSEIIVSPNVDWTMIGLRSSREVFDSTWAILADRVMRPALDSAELEVARAQFLLGIGQRRDDPDALAEHLADSIAFGAHPYATPVTGNAASIRNITAGTLRRYHASQVVTSRMLLVVVGNVDSAHLARLVRGTLARLPRGDYRWEVPAALPQGQSGVVVEARQLPTNYIRGYYAGPLANTEDYQVLRIATAVLTGRMFAEIRTRQNLTYDVHAPFLDRGATAGGLYVSTVSPDKTLRLMRAAISELQTELLDPRGLERLEQQFITEFFLDNETNAAQADLLARAQLYQGDYRAVDRFVEQLRRISPEAVRRVARKYMRGIRFAYVGDPARLDQSLIKLFQ